MILYDTIAKQIFSSISIDFYVFLKYNLFIKGGNMKIKNMQKYVYDLLASGAEPKFYKKYARVEAEKGVPGEKITTVMKDGHVEVSNVAVKVDENGNADWIVTNPDGERYAVPHAKFIKRYELEVGADGKHAPIGAPIEVIEVPEEITFNVPWGENGSPVPMTIRAGGYLNITNLKDIYGIQKDEFENTYAPCNEKGIFNDKELRIVFGQEHEEEKI